MEIITASEAPREVITEVKKLITALGPPPIDLVIIGAQETRLEVGDMYILKISLPLNRYLVLRETALAHATADPTLAEIWSTPPELSQDPLAAELSLALLKRLLDMLVARVDPELLPRTVEVVEGDTLRQTFVRTFATDTSASLAVAGHQTEALRTITQLSSHPIYQTYRRFWDFATSNFKFLPIYNWLQLLEE